MKPASSYSADTFLDNYNLKFNEYANKISAGFFDRIQMDLKIILEKNTGGLLQSKFSQINGLATDTSRDNYDKVKFTGVILQDIAADLMSQPDAEIKRSGVNIINSYFDIARKTEDNELLESARAISRAAKI